VEYVGHVPRNGIFVQNRQFTGSQKLHPQFLILDQILFCQADEQYLIFKSGKNLFVSKCDTKTCMKVGVCINYEQCNQYVLLKSFGFAFNFWYVQNDVVPAVQHIHKGFAQEN